MTSSPTLGDAIAWHADRMARIELALGLQPLNLVHGGDESGAQILECSAELDGERVTLRPRIPQGVTHVVVELLDLADVSVEIRHVSPHSSVTGTPEGSDSAGSPSGDPAESCAEPTGLGAVVRAGNGEVYIRPKLTTTHRHWKNARGMTRHTSYSWADLPCPLTVLSPGCQFLPSGYAEEEF